MVEFQTRYQDFCYTNYDGVTKDSMYFDPPYVYSYTGPNCASANVSSIEYIAVDSCIVEGPGSTVMYASYGSTDSSGGSNGLSTDGKLAIGIVFSFIGGALIAGIVAFMFCKKAPAMSKQTELK
jgi:hypothetical protein